MNTASRIYTTYGHVRGQGPTHTSYDAALRDMRNDHHSCTRAGGYSDRHVCRVDADGYLEYELDDGNWQTVWENGQGVRYTP